MTPVCPILVAANCVGASVDGDKGTATERVEWSECLGSRCAMWWPDSEYDATSGRCGLTHAAQSFRDPALPPSPTPDAEGER